MEGDWDGRGTTRMGLWVVGQVVDVKGGDMFLGWVTNSMSTGLFVLG